MGQNQLTLWDQDLELLPQDSSLIIRLIDIPYENGTLLGFYSYISFRKYTFY